MRRAVIFCLLVWLILIVWAWRAWAAPFLACDLPPAGVVIVESEVRITKVSDATVTVVPGINQVQGTNFKLLDVAPYMADKYIYVARWKDDLGRWSEWSLFLYVGQPAPAVGLRVVP